jgi:hypothetical protein
MYYYDLHKYVNLPDSITTYDGWNLSLIFYEIFRKFFWETYKGTSMISRVELRMGVPGNDCPFALRRSWCSNGLGAEVSPGTAKQWEAGWWGFYG